MLYQLRYEASLEVTRLTCFQRGFIAQLVEHRSGITEIVGWNPFGASEFSFFWPLFVTV